MPKVRFTNAWLQSVKPDPTKKTWYSEAGGKGLRLFVGISGKKTWYVNYRRPGEEKLSQYKIGDADLFSVSQARDATLKFLVAIANGETPWVKPEAPTEKLTLEVFMRDFYAPWVTDNRRVGTRSLGLLRNAFADFMDQPIADITLLKIEQWRVRYRREYGVKIITLNRYSVMLKAALNWGVKRGIIEYNPITRLEKLREDDSTIIVRYLSSEERKRLYAALDAREKRLRIKCGSLKNSAFADHLKPMVMTALHTGIRRGSLFGLLWSDINFEEGILTVRPPTEKNSKQIHVPMNPTLTKTLIAWKEQTGGEGLVFPSPATGTVMDNCKKAWANILKEANIVNFRWHDMRHDFASQLVMKGVDLNTVRELLGHTDMKMTLRYAHLAPQIKRAAVEMLG